MPTVTTANLSNLVKTYYDKRLLERLVPQLMFHQFGIEKELPKHEGNQVYWHRWNLFTKGRFISESAFPTARGMSATRVSATLFMVGDVATITTYIDMVSINSVVQGAIELFADSAALTLDFAVSRMLLWRRVSISATLGVSAAGCPLGQSNYLSGMLNLSSTKWQAPMWSTRNLTNNAIAPNKISAMYGAGATGNSAVLLTPSIIRSLVLKLKVKNALRFDDGYFKAIIHPDLVNQLRGSSAFIDLHKYTENTVGVFAKGNLREGTERGLVGVLEGVKFYESTEAPMCLASAGDSETCGTRYGGGRLYFTFFFGKSSYGVTDFEGGVRTFIKTPGPQSTDNPLDLYSRVGYRIIHTAKVLNPSACLWLLQGKPAAVG
jgi:N4-gp56 family major capsid protein